jgi:hypothetical protein
MTFPMLLPLFIFTSLSRLFLNIGGKSLGYFFAHFMLGYYFCQRRCIQQRLEKAGGVAGRFCSAFRRGLFISIRMAFRNAWFGLFSDFTCWLGILTFMGFGRRYLEKRTTESRGILSRCRSDLHTAPDRSCGRWILCVPVTSAVELQVTLIIIATFVVTVRYTRYSQIPGAAVLVGSKSPAPCPIEVWRKRKTRGNPRLYNLYFTAAWRRRDEPARIVFGHEAENDIDPLAVIGSFSISDTLYWRIILIGKV